MWNGSTNIYAPTVGTAGPGASFSVTVPRLWSKTLQPLNNYFVRLDWPDTTHQYVGGSARVGLEAFKLHVPVDFEVGYRYIIEGDTGLPEQPGNGDRFFGKVTWTLPTWTGFPGSAAYSSICTPAARVEPSSAETFQDNWLPAGKPAPVSLKMTDQFARSPLQ